MVDFAELLAKLDERSSETSIGSIRRSRTSADCARLQESRSGQRDNFDCRFLIEERGSAVLPQPNLLRHDYNLLYA